MASKTIQPAARLAGEVFVPGDKSISHRAVMLGALSETPTRVENFLLAEDCLSTVKAFRQLGIAIQQDGTSLEILGTGLHGLNAPSSPIDCGNSGTTTRLLMGILTGQPFDVELCGDASLSRRPMGRVIEPLQKMGATFPSDSLHLPLRIRGTKTVKPLVYKSPVASAQVKSAILFAGLYAHGLTEVQEPSASRDHSERMLRDCGVDVTQTEGRVRLRGPATLRASHFEIPGDLSSAAFLIAAGVLLGHGVAVQGVGINPTRTGFLDVVKAMNGSVRLFAEHDASGELVADLLATASTLIAFQAKGDLIPRAIDEIPILAVLATQAQGKTVIADAQELRVKESDRLAALRVELSKMGAKIEERPDGLVIDGPTSLKGAEVNSHGDHRLAMSLAIAALVAEGSTTIDDVQCVDTSFPTFWGLLESLRVG